jgi:hypothetical protein
MSTSVSASPGGQPSTAQPIAGPCDSPKDVTANNLPMVLPDMDYSAAEMCAKYSMQHRPTSAMAGADVGEAALGKIARAREGIADSLRSRAIQIDHSSVNTRACCSRHES